MKKIQPGIRVITGCFIALVFVSSCLLAESEGDSGATPRISLAQWSLHRELHSGELDNLDFPKVAAEAFDIHHIEWVSQFFQDKATDRAYLQQMKDRCDEHGVQSLLIMVDGEGNLGSSDPAEREQAVDNHRKWIDAAAFLGAYAIRVNGNGLGDPEDIHRALVTSLRELADIAATQDVSILVENHGMQLPDGTWTADVPAANGAWLAGVLAEVDRPNCGALPDFGNFFQYNRYQGVQDLLPFSPGMSAKSNLFDDRGEEVETSFRRMFDLINTHGYDGYVGIEYEGPDDSGLTERQGIAKTQDLIRRYFDNPRQSENAYSDFHVATVYPREQTTPMGFALVDIDGDEILDLAAIQGGWGSPLVWYERTRQDAHWQRHVIAESGPSGVRFSAGDLAAGDIDGDGDADVVGFEHPGEWHNDYTADIEPTEIHWFENLDHGASWKRHAIGRVPDFVKDVELADFNGDGQLDLVTITYRDEHNFSVFRQDGPSTWARVQNRAIENLHEGMDCGDIDGDGDQDVATNGYWLENPGGSLEADWPLRIVDDMWFSQSEEHWRKNATKVVCRDIDGDRRDEIFIAHSEKGGYPVAWYDSTDPRGGDWSRHDVTTGLTAVHTLALGDLNGDGHLDLLAGENGGHSVDGDDDRREVRLFYNEGNNLTWRESVLKNDGLYNGLIVDIDQDGHLDIAGPASHDGTPYEIWLNRRQE